ncbi:MAG: hypothetical protein LiPW16_52 [Microgenomates group bacterium LiPW_16]|nr:MAG: hypothetical protein LiPW16_52 [Microgenomates group bacterium LiPW_16]
MAIIFQDGKRTDPTKLQEGTRWEPRRGPGHGWVNVEGEDENLFVGFGEEDRVEVRDGNWTLVRGERER